MALIRSNYAWKQIRCESFLRGLGDNEDRVSAALPEMDPISRFINHLE